MFEQIDIQLGLW